MAGGDVVDASDSVEPDDRVRIGGVEDGDGSVAVGVAVDARAARDGDGEGAAAEEGVVVADEADHELASAEVEVDGADVFALAARRSADGVAGAADAAQFRSPLVVIDVPTEYVAVPGAVTLVAEIELGLLGVVGEEP